MRVWVSRMAKPLSPLIILIVLFSICPAHANVSEKVRMDTRKQLVVQTTIFEKTKDGKIPVKTFEIILDKTGPEKFHMHMNDNLVIFYEYTDKELGIRIQYVWTKTVTIDYSSKEKESKDAEALVINVFAKAYFAEDKLLTVKYPLYKLYERLNKLPKTDKTIILNPSGYQHSVLDDVRVFNLPDGEKLYRAFEIHLKIKQK